MHAPTDADDPRKPVVENVAPDRNCAVAQDGNASRGSIEMWKEVAGPMMGK
jgi:hypothetical protein